MNFIISIVISLVLVTGLAVIPFIGVWALDLRWLFGIVIPYAALLTFFIGIVYRVVGWARSPVPYRIPTTAGQQWSHPWIKSSPIDNPKGTVGTIIRMVFEVLTFRSLFRNTKLQFREGPRIGYEWEKWLWLFALAFHYAFLVTVLRHLRFFTEPIPAFVHILENLDGFMQVGVVPISGFGIPGVMLSGMVLLGAVTLLFLRRIIIPQMRYISLPSDYFPLFLIIGIAKTGVLMRYLFREDITQAKELALGLVTFHPTAPEGLSFLFYTHLFLVCILIAYFPFSKLMHLAGVFLSPTRNLSNNSRFVRHVNPWDYPVKVHTYDEYEEEFRDKMIEVGIPVEKTPEPAAEEEAVPQEEGEKE